MSSGSSSNPSPGDFPKTPKPPPRTPSRGRSRTVTQSQIASKAQTRNPSPESELETEKPDDSEHPSPAPLSPNIYRSTSPIQMTTRDQATPKIEPKLGGQHNYTQWILSIEQTLSLYKHGDATIWEIVTGEVTDPSGGSTIKAEKSGNKDLIKWRRDNNFAILTMKRNCEPEAVDLIGLARSAHEAYKELKAKYEGKTVTDLGAIIANIMRLVFDDRKGTIEEHVGEFEKRWRFMRATLSAGFTDKTKEFSEALQKLAWSDQAKAKFLLISLPSFYSNLVENLRAKERYTYGDVCRQITLYVPGRQRQGNCYGSGKRLTQNGDISTQFRL